MPQVAHAGAAAEPPPIFEVALELLGLALELLCLFLLLLEAVHCCESPLLRPMELHAGVLHCPADALELQVDLFSAAEGGSGADARGEQQFKGGKALHNRLHAVVEGVRGLHHLCSASDCRCCEEK